METADRSQPSFIPDLTTGELFVVFPHEGTLRKLTATLPELASGTAIKRIVLPVWLFGLERVYLVSCHFLS
jgi:hypothetical protein